MMRKGKEWRKMFSYLPISSSPISVSEALDWRQKVQGKRYGGGWTAAQTKGGCRTSMIEKRGEEEEMWKPLRGW